MSLQSIGELNQTDKATIRQAGLSYLEVYETYFAPIKDNVLNILELGIKEGGSLRTWQQYFKNSRIYGVDIDPTRANIVKDERIEIIICSQDDQVTLTNLAQRINGFDIILDDASHINQLTVASYNILIPYLRNSGFYIFEDMGCSYGGDMRVQIERGKWPGMEYNRPTINWNNNRKEIEEIFRNLINEMDRGDNKWQFLNFHPMTAILKKCR